MPTNDPRAWLDRDASKVSTTVLAWFPLDGVHNIWYYSKPRLLEKYDELTVFASVDGPVGGLADLSLCIQASDGMTRLKHYSFINLPAADTGQNANPYTITGAISTALLPNPVNQQQLITIGGGAASGTFKLTFDSVTIPATGPTTIPFAGTAAQVQTYLQNLSSVGTALNNNSRAVVTGANGGPWTVQFFDTLLYKDLPLITGDATGLTGGTPTVTIAAVPTGVLAVNTARRFVDEVRVGVKWGTAGTTGTHLILTMKTKG